MMIHILILLAVVGLSAIVFLLATGYSAPRPRGGAPVPASGLDVEDLADRAEKLLGRYGIEVESRSSSGPAETTLIGASTDPLIGGRYVVVCLAVGAGETVPTTRLLGFRDEVKASGATKGMFITDGSYPGDAAILLEDAPVSLLRLHGLGLRSEPMSAPLGSPAPGAGPAPV
jgi:hypothetical protein